MPKKREERKNIPIVFFGTPKFSATILDELKEHHFIPKLIVTAPDKPVGRKQMITPPPVKEWAEREKVPYLQPRKLNEVIPELEKHRDALFIVASYGYLFPQEILDIPERGVLNVHTSLLPRYRGASPIESAILNGDKETGSTIMKMVLKMDAGPIINQSTISLDEEITKPELFERLAHDGGKLLAETIEPYLRGELNEREQDEQSATYCKKIQKRDGDITKDDDLTRWRKYRAFLGWPGVFFFEEDGKRVKVTKARFNFQNEEFIIERVVPEGKREMDYRHYLERKR